MATSTAKETDSLTMCPICFETFKTPKSLPCLHTFCKTCLESLIVSVLEKMKPKVVSSLNVGFSCPICRTFTPLKFTDKAKVVTFVDSLPTNFLVLSLIDKENLRDNRKLCDCCNRQGSEETATSWCCQCTESYCDSCANSHKAMKISMEHKVVKLGEGKVSQRQLSCSDIFCEIHSDKKVEVFCHDHSLPCCIMCLTLKHRKCDQVTTLEEAAAKMRDRLLGPELKRCLGALSEEFKAEINTFKDNKKTWETQKREMRKKMKAHTDAVLKHANELEAKMKRRMDELEIQVDAQLSQETKDLEDKHSIVTQCLQRLDLSMNYENDLQLFLEIKKIEPKVKETKHFLKTAREGAKRYKMKFELNNSYPQWIQTKQLGQLYVTQEPLINKQSQQGFQFTGFNQATFTGYPSNGPSMFKFS